MKKLVCPECVKCAFRKKWCVICKKVVLLALAAVMMAGCEDELNYAPISGKVNQFTIIVVDSCEYLYGREAAGYAGYGFIAHKGNCRFCKERREKEIKELIEQLKKK